MRTSLILCVTFLLLLWRLWNYLVPLQELARILGSTWIALTLSYYLSRFVWTRLFVAEISGDGKAVLITGCDTGFGNRLAKRLSRCGFLVFAGCLESDSHGANELRSIRNVKVLPLDVTKQNQVDDALVSVKQNIGNRVLWSVVANAGIGSRGLLEWLTNGNCDQHFRRQRFRGTTGHQKVPAPPQKKPRKGRRHCEPFRSESLEILSPRISTQATSRNPMIVPYCMSKHAVVSMMDGLRMECHSSGVDFVTVEPSALPVSVQVGIGPNTQ
ncbi:hypothetical protein MRX96_045746 [Rhipicephalus microplus]